MNNESGLEKWNTCQDAFLVIPEIAGTEEPVYACKNPHIKASVGYVVLAPEGNQTVDLAVLHGLCKKEDIPVNEALNHTCGPCPFYTHCE